MTSGTTSTESFRGVVMGGNALTIAASGSLAIIVALVVVARTPIPLECSILAGVGTVVGPVLIIGGRLMGMIDGHKADHQASSLDVQDLAAVRTKTTSTATEVHELHNDTRTMKVVLLRIAQYLVRHQTPTQRDDALLEEVVARLSGVEEDVAALVTQTHMDQGASVLPFPGGSTRRGMIE